MTQMHRILAGLAFVAILSSGVLLTSFGLALADGPDVDITFPVDGGTYNEEQWNAGCNPDGFCGTSTAAATGSGVKKVEVSIQRLGTGKYWDATSFATGSEVFVTASGTAAWSFAFPVSNFPEDGKYTVLARATDSSDVTASVTASFTVDFEPPLSLPPGKGIQEGKPRGFVGVVDSYAGPDPPNSFVLIRQGTGEVVTIHLPAEGLLIFKTPGRPEGMFMVNARVAVLARWDGAMWVAEKGLVKPTKPSFIPFVGVVVSQENGKLTLRLRDGEETTVTISAGDSAPAVGEVVTVFAEPVDDNDGSPAKATGLVRASEVRQRLEGFLEKANQSEGELPEKARKAQSKRVADQALALEGHSAEHVAMVQGLADREDLPPQARVAIGSALDNSKLKRDKSLKIAAKARKKAGPPEGRGKSDSAGQGNTGRGKSAGRSGR